MLAFLRFNINPAKIFMWDSGALALGWMISSLIYLVNIKIGIIIPFMILFWIFWIELMSSFLQISWKKIFKKKLFSIAPFHHMLEYKWEKEHTITMKFRLIQWVLACLTLIIIFYQVNGKLW
jgi:phospho-N-acetylmuramoyl-pentapeptide-transferase